MRTHDLHESRQAALSPAARAVHDRLISGTYEIDLDRLADALLARFETGAVVPCCTEAEAEAVAAGEPPEI